MLLRMINNWGEVFGPHLSPAAGLFLVVLLCGTPLYGTTASWSSPDIDTWNYENAGFPGANPYGSTFAGDFTVNPATNRFPQGSALETDRFSTVLFGFETTDQITAGLTPAQYDVQSVTMTVRYRSGVNGLSQYETAPVDPNQYLAEAIANGSIAPQLPMELYGAGFRDGYEGLALGINQTGDRFSESTDPFGGGPTLVGDPNLETTSSYITYPLVGDPNALGQYLDVSNNISGGFSETAPGNISDPFAATPWAVGTVSTLNVGDNIPVNTTFTFDLNLALPGVESYVQQGLADGAVGFILSTLHDVAILGTSGAYARWHTKEAFVTGAEAATLSIDYSLVAPPIDPDFNGNGWVDGPDFLIWQRDPNVYGGSAGLSAWELEYGNPSLSANVGVVPEPSSMIYVIAGILGICKLRGALRPC